MTMDAKFEERLALINKAIRCEPVDRIPLIWQGTAPAPIQMGITMEEFAFEPLKGIKAQLDYMDKLGVDGSNAPLWFRADVGLTATWLSHIKMPGREMPANMIWQVEEKETMTIEDYDVILNQGFEAFMGRMLPQLVDMQQFQEGAAQMGQFTPVMFQQILGRGYPVVAAGMSTIPFETLCGGRSMMAFFMDLYRIPDKVKEVLDAMTPMYIGMGIQAMENIAGIRGVWVGGWRTASALLAPKLWDKFVFPYMQQVVYGLAENDIISILHLDQDWTRDLERLLELPAKKCVLNLDGMTDIRKARKILGDHMAILGDVPAELLATGTPDQVRDYVKRLIEDIGTTGLLLCPGCDAPINAKHENLMAMYDAGREFGTSA